MLTAKGPRSRSRTVFAEAEEENLRNYQMQAALGSMLRVSLMDVPLEEQLQLILDQIIAIPWLTLESKGCIFLVQDEPDVLIMRAKHGQSDQLVTMCARVPFNRCLCGRAASSGTIEFADCIDERHENLPDGMFAHGHYCVPIQSNSRALGVINLYVREGHRRDKREEEFLGAVADVLAGIVERKQAEDALREAHQELEMRVEERTAALASANEGLKSEIVEREWVEKALRESEERFRTVAETANDAIIIIDRQGCVAYWNLAAKKIFGYRAEEIIGRSCVLLLPERDRPGQLAALDRVMASGHSERAGSLQEGVGLRKDGTEFPGELNYSIWKTREGTFLTVLARDISERKEAERDLKRSFEKLQKTLEGALEAMALTVEIRDPYTAGHQRRVCALACAIAREMGLPQEQVDGIRMAAGVHDIGKICVPAEILSKPGRLTEIEFKLIQTHPQVGYDILKTIDFPWPVAPIVHQHHERLDGSGYPQGLSGTAILLEARILAVSDVVEAMASFRPYRPSLGIGEALGEISRNRGTLYDSEVVDACLRLHREKDFKLE